MLTNAAVKAARPRAAAYKLADELGLHLHVAPTGTKSWRMRYRDGDRREQLLTFGLFPTISLADARARRDEVREQLRRGEDPRAARSPAIASTSSAARPSTFEAAARAWYQHQLPRWTPVHAGDVLVSLERDIFPAIGAMPLKAITAPVVLSALRAVEGRGSIETARRLRQRISAVFDLAESEGWTEHNPATVVRRALAFRAPVRRQPALQDLAQASALLAAADQVDAAAAIRLAHRFLALTAVRLACVRGATWSEIEDLDGPAPLWRIPAARMKLAAAKKADSVHDHLVPLAPAAVEVLRAARAIAGSGELVFPGRAGRAAIGEAAIGELLERAGAGGRHVPHGWRATFSTVLNERYPAEDRVIDQALAHTPKGMSKVEAAYNRSEQLAQRRSLMERWADLLTAA